MRNRWLIVASLLGLLAGCGTGNGEETPADTTPTTPADVAAEVEAVEDTAVLPDKPGLPGPSSYLLDLNLEMGSGITCDAASQVACLDGKTCCAYHFERDLTGLDTKFAFGSTHIAPAVSLAMTDTMYMPTFTVITLNFGIIIGTSDKPPATSTSGEYPFTGFEPEITVTIHNKKYSSKVEGSEGTFDITSWTAEEGGNWTGTLEGTIVQETEQPVVLRAEVAGAFDFILPAPAGGQPGG